MDWLTHLPWGAFLTVAFSLVVSALATWTAYVKFRTVTELGLAAVNSSVKETNERVTTLGAGASTLKTELHEFKEHVRSHYVETGDLNEVKQGFQVAMNDLRDDVRLATATMGDVRDTVIVIASKISPDKPVPPARRRSTSKPGA